MKKIKTSLVLEGGGMRGAYTAGALTWLIENNIEFDNAYGISTGAIHLCNYLMKDTENLFNFSTSYICDKRIIGAKSFGRSGRFVDYDFMFDELLVKQYNYNIEPLKNVKTEGYVGLYELDKGRTEYTSVHDVSIAELKAACTLPLIGKAVEYNGRHLFDGGITEMIPIKQAIDDGCKKHIIITTKPGDFVRKKSKKAIVKLMKAAYPKWPSVYQDYAIRHLNYQKQISLIKSLQEKNEAVYIFPSKNSNVSRLGGSHEELVELFELGKADMEARKAEIFALLGKNA